MKLDRIDDDAEDERDKEAMCDCFFPQCKVSLLREGDAQSVK